MGLDNDFQGQLDDPNRIRLAQKSAFKIPGVGMIGLYIETQGELTKNVPDGESPVLAYKEAYNEMTAKTLEAVLDLALHAEILFNVAPLTFAHKDINISVEHRADDPDPAKASKTVRSTASQTVRTPPAPKPALPPNMDRLPAPYPGTPAPAAESLDPRPGGAPKPANSDGSNFDPALKLQRAPKAAERRPGTWWYERAVRFAVQNRSGVDMLDFYVANPKVTGAIGSISKEVYNDMGLPDLNQLSEQSPLLLTLQVSNKKITKNNNYYVNIVGARYVTAEDAAPEPDEEDIPF